MKFSSFSVLKLNSSHPSFFFFSAPSFNILPCRLSVWWLSNTYRVPSTGWKRFRAAHSTYQRQWPILFSFRRQSLRLRGKRDVSRHRSTRLRGKFLRFLYFRCSETFERLLDIWWRFLIILRLYECNRWFSLLLWRCIIAFMTKISNRPFHLGVFVSPFRIMWCYLRELVLLKFIIFTCKWMGNP